MRQQPTRILLEADVRRLLTMRDAIAWMREAFMALSTGGAVVPVRSVMDVPAEDSLLLSMPAYWQEHHVMGTKLISLHDRNEEVGLPRSRATVVLIDARHGALLGIVEAEHLTAVRTGAGSGLATDLLARRDARVASVFGAGEQAKTQLEAVCAVRPIAEAFVFNRSKARRDRFIAEMRERLGIPVEAGTPEVLRRSDVICTATDSDTPVLSRDDVAPGVHINGVGSYKPSMAEIPPEIVASAKVVVDHRPGCLAEAGDILQPIEGGLISAEHIYAELGEIAAGRKAGRESDDEITFFKSVGNAIQDVVVAYHLVAVAERSDVGLTVAT